MSQICSIRGFFAALLLLFAGCTITTEGVQQFDVPLVEIFPPSKTVASYRQVKAPERISAEDLATQYGGPNNLAVLKKWGALSSLSADYGIPGRPPKARVAVTEMGAKTNAYGAYSNLRPGLLPDSCYVKIGVHGTVDGERLLFIQDRYLITVRDLARTPEPERRTMLINFGRAISERIPRDISDIELVGYLPYQDRVPATERLDNEDPLGLGFMKNGGVTALFRIQNRECKVFLVGFSGHLELNGTLKDVKKIMEKEGPVTELGIGDEGYEGKLFKSLALVSKRELVLFGAYGNMTELEMKGVLAGIDRRVRPFKALQYKERDREKEKQEEEDKKAKGMGGGGE